MDGFRQAIAGSLACVLLFVPARSLSAQHYRFQSYTQERGLHNGSVACLFQDQAGFLWVGTQNGLFRYDGDRFLEYDRADGLPSSQIQSINQSPDGTLWVGTWSGLAQLRDGRFEPLDLGEPVRPASSGSLSFDREGRLYAATDRGLLRIENLPGRAPPRIFWVTRKPAHSVHVMPDKSVWFGCESSLCRLAGGTLETMGRERGLPAAPWTGIQLDRNGAIWISGRGRLYQLPAGAKSFLPGPDLPRGGVEFGEVRVARDGSILMCTAAGLAISSGGKWRVIGPRQGLMQGQVTAVLQDREGSVWIGFLGLGLQRWMGYSEWEGWTTENGLSDPTVWAIQRDRLGGLWIGTSRGLDVLDEATGRIFARPTGSHSPERIGAIATGSDGTIWAANGSGTLSRFDPGGRLLDTFGIRDGLKCARLLGVVVDGEERVWAAGLGKLFRTEPLRPGVRPRFVSVDVPGLGSEDVLYQIYRDRQGRVWLPSPAGLLCWHNGEWRKFTRADGLRMDGTYLVTETLDGSYWLAYLEPLGISRLVWKGDRAEVTHFDRTNGLHSNSPYFLGSDVRGTLWVGTDSGVDAFKDGVWRHYGSEDGLLCDDTVSNAFFSDSNGDVWFGTSRGLSRFRPHESDLAPLPVAITNLELGGRRMVPGASPMTAQAGQSLSVRFAALNYRYEQSLEFEYRLRNLDSSAIHTRQHEVRYANLPPGNYTFEVLARGPNGSMIASPTSFQVFIARPWSQTPAAYACWAFAGALLAWQLWRWRMWRVLKQKRQLESEVAERTSELRTEKARVEEQNREIHRLFQEARLASETKSAFVANMSHEIRTPMNGVIGMIDVAMDTPTESPDHRQYLETARRSGLALLTVINDILDLSKIEAGKLELVPAPFRLRDCVIDALRTVAPRAHEKELELACNTSPTLADEWIGDEGRLRQILLNLVGNAIKFTERGEVVVEIRAEGDDTASQLHFLVRDTGIGIPPEKQATVFDKFTQADGSTTRIYGGTGLGLSISKLLTEMMGGRIWLESEPGRGTTVHFTVRLARSQASLQSTVSELSSSPGAEILVVDDNATSRDILVSLLEGWQMRATAAASARDGMELLASRSFALLLIDTEMPGMSGLEMLECVARRWPGCNVPVILLTPLGLSYDRRGQALDAATIHKPVRPSELQQRIATALGRLAETGQPPETGSVRNVEPLRILLAEDNPVNQKVATVLLERKGHEVTVVPNGALAVAAAANATFDVILMDVQMPEMDGLEATRAIREREARLRLSRIPIVAMTAHAMASDKERCVSAGMDGYVSKPIQITTLLQVIADVCGGATASAFLPPETTRA